MKILKNIFKITLITILLLLNIIYVISNISGTDYLLFNMSVENIYNMLSAPETYIEKDNKMTLIYFYTDESLELEKFNTIKFFIENTDCSKIVNFVEYKIDTNNTNDEIIYNTLTNSSGSNSIVLLNKLGYNIQSFSPNTSVITIENELKEILKNYL